MKEIVLTKGYVALIDDADYEWLSHWQWHAAVGGVGQVYPVRRRHVSESGGGKLVFLHREIMNPRANMQIDHADGNTLDNRRCNLRICTQAENNRNIARSRRNTSGHKGVHWHKADKKWMAMIKVDGKRIWLGRFNSLDDAANAYAEASRKYHKEFGRL